MEKRIVILTAMLLVVFAALAACKKSDDKPETTAFSGTEAEVQTTEEKTEPMTTTAAPTTEAVTTAVPTTKAPETLRRTMVCRRSFGPPARSNRSMRMYKRRSKIN